MNKNAIQFLTALDESAEFFTFQTFDDNALRKDSSLARIIQGPFNNVAEELAQKNNRGAGIFVTINETDGEGRKKGNIARIRAVFEEQDTPYAPRPHYPIEPHIEVETSPGKFHRYWLVENLSLEEFVLVQQHFIAQYGSDPQVKDVSRVMRLPGFNHCKGEPHIVQTTIINKAPPYSRDQILEAFPINTSKAEFIPANSEKANSLRLATQAAENCDRSPSLGRHGEILKLGYDCRRANLNRDDAIKTAELFTQLVRKNDSEGNLRPLTEREVVSGLLNAYADRKIVNAEPHHLTDMGNADRMVDCCGHDIRFIPPCKKWLIWNNQRWLFDEDGAIKRCAKKTVRSIYDEAGNEPDDDRRKKIGQWAHLSEHLSRIRNMIDLAKSDPTIPVMPNMLDTDHWLLGVSNGVVNLKTGGLQEPRRTDYITKSTKVEFIAGAECPQWLSFLNHIMDGNQYLIDFLQRSVGYILTGSTREQCLFLLYGSGANGKSVFLNILNNLLGDYAAQVSAASLMIKRGQGIPNDIARLRGARFVATSEVEEGQRFAESLIKQMTGEDILVARFLHAEFFEFIPSFKIFLAANHKPIIRGDDYAIWRRIHLIPFDVTIPEKKQDKELKTKLSQELPGILNWAIAGCLAWQKEGLNPPKEVRAATDNYRSEMDSIRMWLNERCIIKPRAEVGATDLHEDYKRWAEENTGWFLKQKKFGQKMTEMGGEFGFTRDTSGPWVKYRGIGLRVTDD